MVADALGIPIEQVKEGSRTISPIRVAHTTLLHELRAELGISRAALSITDHFRLVV